MRKNILTVFIFLAALLTLSISGCATQQVKKESYPALDKVSARITEAETMGAIDCAPKELAKAQAALDHAWHEVYEHPDEAAVYIRTAEKAADKLMAKTRPCYEANQPAPELNASVLPASISSGDCAVLSWSSVNATTVTLNPGGENLEPEGAKEVCPTTSTMYQLTANGPGGSVSRSANLDVVETLADVKDPQPVTEARPIAPIYFDYDQDFIREDAKPVLQDVASMLKADNSLTMILEGHCDERGTAEYNMALGQRRAASAKRYLSNLGVESSRLNTLSYGEERPADSDHSEAAWAQNRRVEFVVK